MTTELSKTYEPSSVEGPIYQRWLDQGVFRAIPDERDDTYVIMMPLPNVTGALHMGHAMDNVMQDLLTRWHRMEGDNTLWMPGADHAGIATQAVVEKRLFELEGKTRHDIGRDALVARIWAWKDQYEQRIIGQQQRMGCGCDWERHRFTMDDVCARAVRHTFFKMFADGLIFRGKRLVNWDVFLQTTVSDDEVYHETVKGHFWHLRYPILDPQPGEPDHVVVATTRPETMLGDTAVAVHPDPEVVLKGLLTAASGEEAERIQARIDTVLPKLLQLRDMALAGRKVRLPLLNREIPLITDVWAKPELGSGCVKITPAHDPNDYAVWTRHKDHIDIINVLNADGTYNSSAGPYAGLERYAVRDKVLADLDSLQLVAEVEDREVEIGHSDRSKTPVEPFLSDQWFVRMGDVPGGIVMGRGTAKEHRSAGLVQAAMDAVNDGRVTIHPHRYTKTYLDWLAEKRDWPVSRQLWWGHQIPVWSKVAAWSELDLSELDGLKDRLGDKVCARVQFLDGDGGLLLGPDGLGAQNQPAASERCALDVCLIEDDPGVVAFLEAIGFARDPDVLDTWFSSALWPFSTLGWPDPATAALRPGQLPTAAIDGRKSTLDYYYPGSCLVTGRDIITLWVARMVLAGLYDLGDIPFSDVFIHANILDGNGERMSKSKGNGIDPVDIIEAYGTDAMRYVLCDMQTGTQDIRLPVTAICPLCEHHNDLSKTRTGKSIFIRICGSCKGEFDVLGTIEGMPAGKLISERFEIGRAFCTKLWNSARFAFMNLQGDLSGPVSRDQLFIEDRWILDRLNQAASDVQQGLQGYNPSAAINAARDFFWNSLCDWYLEIIKPRLFGNDAESARVARRVLAWCLDQVLRLLHPFVPFITEELWGRLNEVLPDRSLGEWAPVQPSPVIVTAAWPRHRAELADPVLAAAFADLQALTRAIRTERSALEMSPHMALKVTVKPSEARRQGLVDHGHVVRHLANLSELLIDTSATRQPGSAARMAGDLEFFVHDVIDDAAELQRLKAELQRVDKEIGICDKKLTNEQFVARAPAQVVAEQRERRASYVASKEAIARSLAQLS